MKRGGRRIEAEVVEDAVGWTHHGRCPGETRARNPEVLRPSTVPRGSSPRGTAPPLRRRLAVDGQLDHVHEDTAAVAVVLPRPAVGGDAGVVVGQGPAIGGPRGGRPPPGRGRAP